MTQLRPIRSKQKSLVEQRSLSNEKGIGEGTLFFTPFTLGIWGKNPAQKRQASLVTMSGEFGDPQECCLGLWQKTLLYSMWE